MRIFNHSKPLERGTVLYVTVIITAIVSVGLASYLKLTFNQQQSIARSSAWNEAIVVAEAGIEEGLAQIAEGITRDSMIDNGWRETTDTFVKQGDLNGKIYIARISKTIPPVIESRGIVTAAGSSGSISTRSIRVTTRTSSLFTKAMAAKNQIDMSGNNVTTDSFDSEDPNYSTAGLYDSSKTKSNGDVATNSELINSLDVGNANIHGRVATGPGGTIAVGSNGAVGDASWHAAGRTGIQPGWSNDDMNVAFPDVEEPFTTGFFAPAINQTIDGVSYSYVLSRDEDYSLSEIRLSGQDGPILVTGKARLYVTGDVSISGNSGIVIAEGASLNMYVAGRNGNLTGQGVVNANGDAQTFRYWGLPSNTDVKLSGNSEFVGTIYAPGAHLHLAGGGRDTTDFIGSSVSNTVKMNGHFNFHYDEALGRLKVDGNYIINSWNEVSTTPQSPDSGGTNLDGTTEPMTETVALR